MKNMKLSYYKAKDPLELTTFVNGLDTELKSVTTSVTYDGEYYVAFYYI